MRMVDIIAKKRDGKKLLPEEIDFFINGYVSGEIKDYQAAALLMAVYFNGLDREETNRLTTSMAKSGDTIDLSTISGIKVDKHSTGGVGDKTTLVVLPVVAALGVPVAKMSGRALGYTGGTIDKMESIPGIKTTISKKAFLDIVKKTGFCVMSQSGNVAPADKKLYSLRDVTATVGNMQLIAASVMSKKIACGCDRILLDVKTGTGAFMETLEESINLAGQMVGIGESVGKKTVALVTNMDAPLGCAIGNSLEVMEACDVLKGRGDEKLTALCIEIAAQMLNLAELGDPAKCRDLARSVIENGRAFEKLKETVQMLGGDTSVLDDYKKFKLAALSYKIEARQAGILTEMDAQKCGIACALLGAGRETKDSDIDLSAGILLNKQVGDTVDFGDTLATFYAEDENKCKNAEKIFNEGIKISSYQEQQPPLILARVSSHGVEKYV